MSAFDLIMKQREHEEKCYKCKYYRQLKHNYEKYVGYEYSKCCVVVADKPDSYVVEVNPNDCCEMFLEKGC